MADINMTLPMPAHFTNHGKTKIIYYADTGGNDAYEAECKRHYFRSGPKFCLYDDAEKWKCPKCLEEKRKHEIATRDD